MVASPLPAIAPVMSPMFMCMVLYCGLVGGEERARGGGGGEGGGGEGEK